MSTVSVVALALAGLGAVTDARSGRIPNAVTLPTLAFAVLGHAITGGVAGLGRAAGGIAVGGAVPLLLFRRGAMGGGDVKLLVAIGALLGPTLGLEIQGVTYVAAALCSMVVLLRQGALGRTLVASAGLVLRAKGMSLPSAAPEGVSRHTVRLGIFVFVVCVLCLGRAGASVP